MIEALLRELGVRPMINAAATQTPIGGSRIHPRVIEAMSEASQVFVDLRALHAAVGGEIARLTHNEAAMVSAGVASAIYLATMALLKRAEPQGFEEIASLHGKHSVLIYDTHCVEYVIGVELAGVRLRRISVREAADERAAKLEEELEREKPLALLYVLAGQWIAPGAPPLERAIEICARHHVPVIVDAAAQLPPKENLWKFTRMGAALALFSGGKDLRGPGNTGLVLGERELVDLCRNMISPNEGVGRFFKVGKEDLAAMLVAVRAYMEADEAERLAWCESEVRHMMDALSDVQAICAERAFPNEAGQPIPRVFVRVKGANEDDIERVCEAFRQGETPVAFLPDPMRGGFYVNPMTLAQGESEIVVRTIKTYFGED